MTAPRLAAAKLMRLNRRRRAGIKPASLVLLGLGVLLGLFWAEATVAPSLKWLRLHALLCAGVAAIASALLTARRRALKRSEFARSWLASVPVSRSTARWESLLIEALPATAAIGLLTIAGISYTLVLLIANRVEISALLAVWSYLCGGIALGVAGSFLVPQAKPIMLPPGSRYVPQSLRRAAKFRPSLKALGSWPIRQAFAWAQPKIVARATIPVLLIMPLGTMADSAMVVIGLFGTISGLLLVCSGVIAASSWARRWLAPLPVRPGEVIRAFLLPACAVIVASGAIEALLLAALDVSYRTSAAVSAATVVLGCASLSGGLIWNWNPSRYSRRPRT
jgi:hypothetical protein